jgi:hypothetical protein
MTAAGELVHTYPMAHVRTMLWRYGERPKAWTAEERRQVHRQTHKRWDEEEEARLRIEFNRGLTVELIAELHGRTQLAVHTRLARLGLMEPPEGHQPDRPSSPAG